MLFNLRTRLSRIRVFDPACGSGNFLVIAYIRMREIEDEIMRRRGEALDRSAIRLTQFFGIEIKSFAAEIARLSLLIAEFQCDVRFIGQTEARALVLPLHATGNIRQGNALRIDWEEVCPSVTVSAEEQDLGGPTGRLNLFGGGEEWETYICGNPPYRGSKWQTLSQKDDLKAAWSTFPQLAKTTDYVTGWLAKAHDYLQEAPLSKAAFVMTNSVVQGQQAGDLWSPLFDAGTTIFFAHLPFIWKNLAANNAGVTVIVVGFTNMRVYDALLFDSQEVRTADSIGCFLIPNQGALVRPHSHSVSGLPEMVFGNMPRDGGGLILTPEEADALRRQAPDLNIVRPYVGSQELIRGQRRYCMWIEDSVLEKVRTIPEIARRLDLVRDERKNSKAASTRAYSEQPHRFVQRAGAANNMTIAMPGVSSENREYLPADILPKGSVISNKNFGLFDADIFNFALMVSKLHVVWVGTVCVRMRSDFSYSNTLGWNTFPVPKLTETDKANLTLCAEDILLAREAHFPATIAELYNPDNMPADLRVAHDRNDETLERIYIGRRFRNDTERLEKLFEMYTKTTAKKDKAS